MKKMEKVIYIIRMMAEAIRDFRQEISKVAEQCGYKHTCLYNYEDIDDDTYQPNAFITLFDKDNKRISGNWVPNESCCYDFKSSRVDFECWKEGVSILHYLWGNEDSASKVRFVEISDRHFIVHNTRKPYNICKEFGIRYDLFSKKKSKYVKSFSYPYDVTEDEDSIWR